MTTNTHSIQLELGYRDPKGTLHTDVTFGHLIAARELFQISEDRQAQSTTQYKDLLLRAAITKFGTLKLPVALSVLLALDSIDRDDLYAGVERFEELALEGRQVEFISDTKLKLAFGYESNGIVYDVVEFGTRITGMDEIEADRTYMGELRRRAFLAGKQATRMAQSDGASTLDGAIGLDIIERLYAVDTFALQAASETWRQSFRRSRKAVQENGSEERADFGDADGVERGSDSPAAGGAS